MFLMFYNRYDSYTRYNCIEQNNMRNINSGVAWDHFLATTINAVHVYVIYSLSDRRVGLLDEWLIGSNQLKFIKAEGPRWSLTLPQ